MNLVRRMVRFTLLMRSIPPDSSRYFYSDKYQEHFEKDLPQKQLSKEFVREWLMDNGFQGKAEQKVPEITDDFVNQYLKGI